VLFLTPNQQCESTEDKVECSYRFGKTVRREESGKMTNADLSVRQPLDRCLCVCVRVCVSRKNGWSVCETSQVTCSQTWWVHRWLPCRRRYQRVQRWCRRTSGDQGSGHWCCPTRPSWRCPGRPPQYHTPPSSRSHNTDHTHAHTHDSMLDRVSHNKKPL